MENQQLHSEHETTTSGQHNSLGQDNSSISGSVFGSDVVHKETTEVSKPNNDVANNKHVFREDLVRSKCSGMIGIVMGVSGIVDLDSSIMCDNEGDDADENGERGVNNGNKNLNSNSNANNSFAYGDHRTKCYGKQVDVLWMDESDSTENLNDLIVVNRRFLHNNFVTNASHPTGQVGVVVDVSISVDLMAHDGTYMKDISSKELKRMKDFVTGDFVVLGPWLGRIKNVRDNVTVMFDDGSICEIMKVESSLLEPVYENFLDDANCPNYPGQRVRDSSSLLFKNSKWISGSWKPSLLEGIVTKVTVESVLVNWIVCADFELLSSTSPAEEQSPMNLKLLPGLMHTNWKFGWRCFFPSAPSSIVLDNGLSKTDLHDSSVTKLDSMHAGSGFDSEVALDELSGNNESMDVDRVTADKNMESNISPESSSCGSFLSVSKEPIHETWPPHLKKSRKVVVQMDKNAPEKVEKFERALLIVNVCTKLDVTWQDSSRGSALSSTTLIPVDNRGEHEFMAELYVIEKALDDDDDDNVGKYRHVGVVKSVSAKEGTTCVRWLKPASWAEGSKEFEKEEIVSVYEIESHRDYEYCYGDMVVRCSGISTSSEAAVDFSEKSEHQSRSNEAIHGIEKCPRSEKVKSEACMDFSDLSWVGNITNLKNGDIEVTWADGRVSMVDPHVIYVVGPDEDSGVIENDLRWEIVYDREMDALETGTKETLRTVEVIDLNEKFIPETYEAITPCNVESDREKEVSPEVLQAAEIFCSMKNDWAHFPAPATYADDSCSLKQFDITKDPLDHYFLDAKSRNNKGRKWLKKVQQDWSILENNLPDGIFVRVYEDRMDLLRAFIVGAYETPYQDGIFFFDFHLPPEYPDVPPSVHYNSGGLRINPNLYEEGKICLSLLNTWTGKGNEVWDRKSSSILQVLVSLQGLVLNSKPYFNEAGYDQQIGTAEGEKNSLSLYENVFLLNCKTMMYIMQKPPKEFEELIKQHFRRRGYFILKACDLYMKGELVGSLTKDACASAATDNDESNKSSAGFKMVLDKIFQKLFMALDQIGADCDDFKHIPKSS